MRQAGGRDKSGPYPGGEGMGAIDRARVQLPVDFAQDEVEAAHNCYDVAHFVATEQFG